MACVEALVYEADVFEVGLFANYSCEFIKEIRLSDSHIYLNPGIVEYNPVGDLYTEVRTIRRLDESLRVMDIPMKAQGNEPTGPGTATPRRIVLYDPWKISPDPDATVLTVTGEQISDVGTKGASLLDFTAQTAGTALAVSYAPADAEIVYIEVESPLQDRLDYQGVIYINTVTGTAGSIYPYGTSAQPVDNYTDALILAATYGITRFDLTGTLVIGASESIADTQWDGNNPIRDVIVLQGGDTTFATMADISVAGLVNGRIYMKEGAIAGNLSNFSGGMAKSVLAGSLTIDPTFTDAVLILQCASGIPGTAAPVINMNSSTAPLQVRDYFGGIELQGFDQGQGGSLDVTGTMKIDFTTCTAGSLVYRGDGRVVDAATGLDVFTGITGGVDITNFMNSPTAHADAVWSNATRTLTSAGAGGATAQEVWEYATRDLTTSAGVTAQNIADIVDGVWDEPVAEHAEVGSTGEKIAATSVVDNDAIAAAVWAETTRTLTSAAGPDAATIATAVWSNVTRSLTVAAGVTVQDIADISTAVWSETVRALTVQTGLTTAENTQLMALDTGAVGLTAAENTQLMAIDTAPNGLTIAENAQLMSIPLETLTPAQAAELSAIPSAAAISSAVWSETVRDLTIAAGLTPAQEVQLLELWQLQGLDINNPMTVTQTTRIASAISLLFSGDGVNSTTTTRQP